MTIAEVCKKYDLTADTLRYYEKIGLIPPVNRSNGGIRNYNEDSCKWVELMKCLRQAGVQIDALVEYVRLFKLGDDTLQQRKDILSQQRELLIVKRDEIQTSINRIDYKLTHYDEMLDKIKLK